MAGIGRYTLQAEKQQGFQASLILAGVPHEAEIIRLLRTALHTHPAHLLHHGGKRKVVEIHIGQRAEQRVFHKLVKFGRTHGHAGQRRKFAHQHILKMRRFRLLAAHAAYGAARAFRRLFALKTKHFAHGILHGIIENSF